MPEFIRASVATIEALFQQRRVVELPWFQRAYAWREDNVLRLVADVQEAIEAGRPNYSLGHIHLAGTVEAAKVALIDGHQRAITLALLFAVLRDITAGDLTMPSSERAEAQQRLHALLCFADNAEAEYGAKWRLVTQPQMADFFRRFVQEPGATLVDPDDDFDDLSPAERNLISNRDRLRYELGPEKLAPHKRVQFCAYLLAHCHVVIVEVDDEDEAWSMLGVQQMTRLPHDVTEQAKIAIIYSMPKEQQEEAASIWEGNQARLGNERLGDLLSHLRTQKLEHRSTKPLEGDLQQLYGLNVDGLGFMKTIFRPHADAMLRIKDRQLGAGVLAHDIHRNIDVLGWLDHRQWEAPVLAWLTSKGDLHRDTVYFFALLERLAWMLRLAGTDPHEQELRFIRLTRAVASQSTPVRSWPEFEISDKVADEALAILRSRTFYYKHMSKLVLRRLCFELGHDPGFIDGETITVEHILPRKPHKDRQWLKTFGSLAGVKAHADRLGNLALLSGKQNREADTKDWPAKRSILRRCSEDGKSFRLAAEAVEYEEWTPKVIEARTEKLIGVLFRYWGVPVTLP